MKVPVPSRVVTRIGASNIVNMVGDALNVISHAE